MLCEHFRLLLKNTMRNALCSGIIPAATLNHFIMLLFTYWQYGIDNTVLFIPKWYGYSYGYKCLLLEWTVKSFVSWWWKSCIWYELSESICNMWRWSIWMFRRFWSWFWIPRSSDPGFNCKSLRRKWRLSKSRFSFLYQTAF